MFYCIKCGKDHRRSSKKGEDHLQYELKEIEEIQDNDIIKISKKEWNNFPQIAKNQMIRLYKKYQKTKKRRYIKEINKVIIYEIENK